MTKKSPSDALFERAIEATRDETAEGLDTVRRDAAFSSIVERKRRRAPPIWVWGAAAAAVTAVALVFLFRPTPPPSTPSALTVVYREGAVRTASGSVVTDETPRTALDSLRIEAGARVDVAVEDVAELVVVGPGTLVREVDGFTLQDGVAAFAVRKRSPETPFVIRVGEERVVVRGTRFDVHARDGQLVAVHVDEGRVDVRAEGRTVQLTSGRAHVVDERVPSIVNKLDAVWWQPSEAGGYLHVDTEPPNARVIVQGESIGRSPLMVRWRPGTVVVRAELDGYVSVERRVELRRDGSARVRLALAMQTTVAVEASPTKRRTKRRTRAKDLWAEARALLAAKDCDALDVAARALFDRSRTNTDRARARMLSAECSLRSGKRERALTAYRAVVKDFSRTPSGESALFEVAKILAETKKPKAALDAFDRYLASYENGRFADPASMRRCELLIRRNRLGDAKRCLEKYRSRFPKGLRLRQANLLYAELLHRDGDCTRAVEILEAVLKQSPSQQEAERARRRIKQCAETTP